MSDTQPSKPGAPPPLAIVSVILWYLLSGFCGVIALVLLKGIGFAKPLPVVYSLVGLVLFALEARWVWTGRRSDVLWSGLGSLALAAFWWFMRSGEAHGFAYVPPSLMIAAGLAILISRRAYLDWCAERGPPATSDTPRESG